MRRLQTAILMLMLAGAVTFTAWPSPTAASQSANENSQSRNETPDIVYEPLVFVNETVASVIKASAEEPTAPEPEYFDEATDPTFTGYPEPPYSEQDIEMLAQMVWGEARGCAPEEQALCVWTVINRLESGRFGETLAQILTTPHQFAGYSPTNPVTDEIRTIVEETLAAWAHGEEPPTLDPYTPTTPYLFFDGDGRHNWFREGWR